MEPESAEAKPAPGAPPAPARRSRSRAAAKPDPAEAAPDSAPAAAAKTPPPEASDGPAAEGTEGAVSEARPRRRRSRSGASKAEAPAAVESASESAGDAPAPAQAPSPSSGETETVYSSSDTSIGGLGETSQTGAATTGRTRNRRRRSRGRGGGSGSDQTGRPNGSGPVEAGKAPEADDGSTETSATAPAAGEAPAETREHREPREPREPKEPREPREPRESRERSESRDRSSSSSSSGRSKKRRSSRRPRMEHIVPLGPRKMLVTAGDDRSQIAVLEGRELIEHYVAKREDLSIVGNIYIGRVENVLPGMEAAFLDIGESRNAVLYVGEVSYEEDLDGPPPRIETLLKSGQAVVAQVTKDPMGSKGARLTTEVSLAGRYLVLVPNTDSLGISRRLADAERRRLRDIATRIRPEGHGMIVRTAAIGASEEDLERDVARLTRIWNEVSERIDGSKPPKLIYSEPPLAIRVVRDLFTADVEQVIVDSEESYNQIRDYLEEVAPDFEERVELYSDPMPLFERYHVLEQVRKGVDRKVWLASGGHIVIDRTEAMTVVDVNTGRFVGRSTLEDTVLHANLEAAEEIAKQLRLRDIGGIIVIDFIDMGYERNRDELLRTFERALLRDKTRTQVYGVSELGLVQMTRKKVSEGLLEAFSTNCEACAGRGVVLSEIH